MYLALRLHPDIAYAVTTLSQFNANPGRIHWTAAKHVVQYLKGTPIWGLTIGGKQPLVLTDYTDASFGSIAGPLGSHRSILAFAFSLSSSIISWSSHKQCSTASSMCEAEFITAMHAAKEALWLRTVFTELELQPTGSIPIHCNNQSSIHLTHDQSFHDRSKHINIQHHFIRDAIEAGSIHYSYINTKQQLADVLTKPLARIDHNRLCEAIGLSVAPFT
ncbi:hypothetical protein EW146_g4453 [Bondarzewia mesenterica]|uniref:Reverse transcriptase Ty1/copia-type domain-containing protein n=1 Tax=Bondarzewia mesenterica TaxID=1095465 RepID=A0A4S4LWE4_9AGAM|nr:hypothetical protein EW146_g4453 [Bondarzewia mesenterica]